MMGLENPLHLIFLLAVLLMLFGAKRLPEMGRGLGSGMRGFKDALSGIAAPSELEADTGEALPSTHLTAAADSPVEAA